LRDIPEDVVTPPPAGQPGHGIEAFLRSQPVRIKDGRVEGGYTDVYELICPSCGDHLDLDYSEISPRLQWLRGPYMLEAALAVFHKHQGIPWSTPSWKLQDPALAKARSPENTPHSFRRYYRHHASLL